MLPSFKGSLQMLKSGKRFTWIFQSTLWRRTCFNYSLEYFQHFLKNLVGRQILLVFSLNEGSFILCIKEVQQFSMGARFLKRAFKEEVFLCWLKNSIKRVKYLIFAIEGAALNYNCCNCQRRILPGHLQQRLQTLDRGEVWTNQEKELKILTYEMQKHKTEKPLTAKCNEHKSNWKLTLYWRCRPQKGNSV